MPYSGEERREPTFCASHERTLDAIDKLFKEGYKHNEKATKYESQFNLIVKILGGSISILITVLVGSISFSTYIYQQTEKQKIQILTSNQGISKNRHDIERIDGKVERLDGVCVNLDGRVRVIEEGGN